MLIRTPKYLQWLLKKLDFLGLPNLGNLICAFAVLGFIGKTFLGIPVERFVFDPGLVLGGEWWRLFSFPVSEGNEHPLFFLFYVLYIYFVMNGIEGAWGPGPLTVFTLFGYVAALGASFATGVPLSIWYYVLMNVSLAFGTLFPDMEFYLFFILPVKAKWLALLTGAALVFQFALGGLQTKLQLLMVMLPYLVFFGPSLWDWGRTRYRVYQNRRK